MLDLPNKPVHELSDREMIEVEHAESTLNEDQWTLFQHLLEKGETVRESMEKVREQSTSLF